MKKTLFLAVISLTVVFGAGCKSAQPPAQTRTNPLPQLDIVSPGLSTSTWQTTIHIIGNTDAKTVWVAHNAHEPYQGKFDIEVKLDKEQNSIPVAVGNGVATTTISVNVAKITLPVSNAQKTTVPTTRGTTRAPAIIPKAPTAKPAPPAAAVTFSGSEMQSSVSLDSYGANLAWTRSDSIFQTYVIVKSTTDPNLYFPKQFWVKSFNDIDTRSWRDTAVAAGKTTYYRVCKIAPDQSITCGNAVHVTK